MRTEPREVGYLIEGPTGLVLDKGRGTLGEVDMIRSVLTTVFPKCTLHVIWAPPKDRSNTNGHDPRQLS